MSRKLEELDQAMNVNERFMRNINIRLDVVIEQLDSLISYIAQKDGIAIEERTITDSIPEKKERKKVVK